MEVRGCQNNVSPGLSVHYSPLQPEAARSHSRFVPTHIRRLGHLISLERGRSAYQRSNKFFIHYGIGYILRKFCRNPIFRSIDLSRSRAGDSVRKNADHLSSRPVVLLFEIISREWERSSINGPRRARTWRRRRTRNCLSYNVVRVWRIQVGHAPRTDLKGLIQGRFFEGRVVRAENGMGVELIVPRIYDQLTPSQKQKARIFVAFLVLITRKIRAGYFAKDLINWYVKRSRKIPNDFNINKKW